MKKYSNFLCIGIIIFLVPILGLSIGKKVEKDIPLCILEDMGGKFLEADVSGGREILNKFVEEEEMVRLGEEIRFKVGLIGDEIKEDIYGFRLGTNGYSKKIINDNNFRQLTIWGINNEGHPVTIIFTSYRDEEGKIEETTLFINFIIKKKYSEINDIINKVEKIFKEFDKDVEINTCIVGNLNGRLNSKESERKILRETKNIKGEVIERFVDDDMVSITAYTPYIDKYIYVGKDKINLNIAMRYSEYEDKTYLWIGIPIITISY